MPMDESTYSKKYKKKLEEEKKKADAVLKKLPDNKIAKAIKARKNRELKQDDKDSPEAKTWSFVQTAYYTAQDIYMDGEASLDEALAELIDALQVCRQLATEKGESGKVANPKGKKAKEEKEMAEEVGY